MGSQFTRNQSYWQPLVASSVNAPTVCFLLKKRLFTRLHSFNPLVAVASSFLLFLFLIISLCGDVKIAYVLSVYAM